MSEEQFPQKEIIEENKDNNQEINKMSSVNPSNMEIEKDNLQNNQEKKEELKLGQYILTPLQSILINKKMPFGIKLETEENILKSMETAKNQTKKNKNSVKHKEKLGREKNNYGGIMMNKKRNLNIDNTDNKQSNMSQENYNIFKKCKKCLEKIKDSKYANRYYQSNNPDVPCLAEIEKNLNNNEYKGIYEFQMDVRRIWSYYFNKQQDNEITSKMSDEWEKICAELDNQNQNNNEIGVDFIKKRTSQIQKEYNEYKINNASRGNLPAPVKKITPNNEHNKPMTVEEKNQLGNNIRSLNKEQLKGIIKILSENNPTPTSKYFEFDIDQLSTKKLRELEKYVKECLASNTKVNKNNSSNSNTHNKNINNKNLNQRENQNNKNNNKGNNGQPQIPAVLKSNNKNENKSHENKVVESAKKNMQSNKKPEKKNDSFSDSNSMSSDSSLSS